jgi:hypothetical protein
MAVLNFTGFEIGIGGEQRSTVATGGIAYNESGTVHNGKYALKIGPTGANIAAYGLGGVGATGTTAGLNLATGYAVFWVNIGVLPASNNEVLCVWRTLSANKLEVRVTSAGKLQAYDSTGAQLGSDGSTSLSTGVWYKIKVKCGTSTSPRHSPV